jgi:hypothetical protein
MSKTIPAMLLVAVWMLISCSNNNQNQSSTSDTSKTATTTETANTAPASSTITTPQNMLVVLHKVANFAKWKMAYDGHDTARTANGIHSFVIGRGLQDSNVVLVAMRVDDTTKAMAFGKSPGLKAAMQKGGVIGAPRVGLVTLVFQDTANISTDLRSSASFTVKDWDTWLKNFQSGEQERKDNGIAVRAYGHDAADNHKVRVVTALTDSAKAVAYYKSDAIKKRMEASGVMGQPERFLYRIVQRY